MSRVEETALPGVGKRFELATESGQRIGVIRHRTGRRELYVTDDEDADLCRASVQLDEDESNALADILGGSQLVRELESLHQDVEGLAIDWLHLEPVSPYAGRTIGDARIRTRTGVSVVAVIRDGTAFPAPAPDFTLEADDTMLVVGTVAGIEQVNEIIATG